MSQQVELDGHKLSQETLDALKASGGKLIKAGKGGGKVTVAESPKVRKYWAEEVTVKVFRINCPDEMRQSMIDLCVNNFSNKKPIRPGVPTKLTRSEAMALEQAKFEITFHIPETSGVYTKPDPIAAAKELYPAYDVQKNWRTGLIDVSKGEPQYMIQYVSEPPV